MNMKPFAVLISLVAMLAAASPLFAAGGGNLQQANVHIRDTAAAQRGAKLFVNYCMACHSASLLPRVPILMGRFILFNGCSRRNLMLRNRCRKMPRPSWIRSLHRCL